MALGVEAKERSRIISCEENREGDGGKGPQTHHLVGVCMPTANHQLVPSALLWPASFAHMHILLSSAANRRHALGAVAWCHAHPSTCMCSPCANVGKSSESRGWHFILPDHYADALRTHGPRRVRWPSKATPRPRNPRNTAQQPVVSSSPPLHQPPLHLDDVCVAVVEEAAAHSHSALHLVVEPPRLDAVVVLVEAVHGAQASSIQEKLFSRNRKVAWTSLTWQKTVRWRTLLGQPQSGGICVMQKNPMQVLVRDVLVPHRSSATAA